MGFYHKNQLFILAHNQKCPRTVADPKIEVIKSKLIIPKNLNIWDTILKLRF